MKIIILHRQQLASVLILLIYLFISSNDSRAVEWQVALEVSNGSANRDTITFGVHPDATPGIDPALGEVELPPWPPSSLFEVRFMVPGTEGVNLDLQDTTHTERSHTVKWQAGSGGYPVTVRWSIPSLPHASLYIADGYGGVFIPPVNMFAVDSLQVPTEMSYITQLTITAIPGVKPNAYPQISYIPDAAVFVGQQFPEYSLDDYVFDPDTPDDSIQWFVTNNQALIFDIDQSRTLHILAPQGWTGSETVTFTARDPELHTDQKTATFTVSPSGLPSWLIQLTVSNGALESRSIQIGIDPKASDGIDPGLGEVALPPWPPSSAFDARLLFPDGFTWSTRDIRYSGPDSIFYHLKWQAGSGGYPITIKWPASLPLGDFTIQDEMGGIFIPPTSMSDTTSLVVPPGQSFITGLIISALAVVDTVPPLGPEYLLCNSPFPTNAVQLQWPECIEEHFAYYEILYDTTYFDLSSKFVWDWTEDSALMQKSTTSTIVSVDPSADHYTFRIRAWDTFGNVSSVSQPIVITQASWNEKGKPRNGLDLRTWPNPFRNSTTLWFFIPGMKVASISIYDVVGRRIKRFIVRSTSDFTGIVKWDGRSRDGGLIASGLYFCRLETKRGSISRKILLLR